MFRSKELQNFLSGLNPSKALGPDEFHPRVFKELASELGPMFAHLFQQSIDTGEIPRNGHLQTCIFYSILLGPILERRRGTTGEFTTAPFHLVLFSAALVELAKSIPVHSLILSSQLFFCLPFFFSFHCTL